MIVLHHRFMIVSAFGISGCRHRASFHRMHRCMWHRVFCCRLANYDGIFYRRYGIMPLAVFVLGMRCHDNQQASQKKQCIYFHHYPFKSNRHEATDHSR